jgi:hypothetical protein
MKKSAIHLDDFINVWEQDVQISLGQLQGTKRPWEVAGSLGEWLYSQALENGPEHQGSGALGKTDFPKGMFAKILQSNKLGIFITLQEERKTSSIQHGRKAEEGFYPRSTANCQLFSSQCPHLSSDNGKLDFLPALTYLAPTTFTWRCIPD